MKRLFYRKLKLRSVWSIDLLICTHYLVLTPPETVTKLKLKDERDVQSSLNIKLKKDEKSFFVLLPPLNPYGLKGSMTETFEPVQVNTRDSGKGVTFLPVLLLTRRIKTFNESLFFLSVKDLILSGVHISSDRNHLREDTRQYPNPSYLYQWDGLTWKKSEFRVRIIKIN